MITFDDTTAIRILKTIAQSRLRKSAPDLAPITELRAAIASAFGESPESPPTTAGDLARTALDLLSQDPAWSEHIHVLTLDPSTIIDRYEPTVTIAVTTAALLVLQSRIKFKAGAGHSWSIEIEKKAADNSTLKLLAQRLLALLPH